MPPPNKRDENIELLKLVGAVLDNDALGDRARRTWKARLRRRIARLVPRRLRALSRRRLLKLWRKHRLALGCVGLGLIPLYALVVVSGTSAQEEAPRTSSGPLTTAPPPPLPTWSQETARMPGLAQSTNPLGHWLERLEDPDWQVRSEAAYELRRMSRESNVAASALALVLEDLHAGPRLWAADGLRARGLHLEGVREAVRRFAGNDELLQMYRSGSRTLRDSFERIVKRWLREKDDLYRWTALTLCGKLENRREAFRPLLEIIAEADPQVSFRRQAGILLREL